LIFFTDRAYRTDRTALAALNAHDIVEITLECRPDNGFKAAILRKQCTDTLCLGANRNTPPARYALCGIADESRRTGIRHSLALCAGVSNFSNTEIIGYLLKFAVIVAVACLAVAIMLAEKKFDNCAPRFADFLCISLYLHPFGHRHRTRCDKCPCALNLDKAHTAGADRLHILEVTQRRNGNTGLASRFDDKSTLRNFNFYIIHCNRWHFKFSSNIKYNIINLILTLLPIITP
jgi:hypothetical protein